ncbi:MAG TPA: CAP domain-containing protein [Symbiobacteriaceae bacterium]|nr:CAP domain-containing protein [Symbiobacteriaceae bacterium]
MNSPGHRANILKPEFTKIGIGIVSGGPYGLMVTQQFIGE